MGRSLVTFKVFHAAASTPILRSPTSGYFIAVFPLLILGLRKANRRAIHAAARYKDRTWKGGCPSLQQYHFAAGARPSRAEAVDIDSACQLGAVGVGAVPVQAMFSGSHLLVQ